MTPEAARSLIERAADSWIKGDAKAFAALFTSDGEFVVPGQKLVGVSAIEKIAADFAKSHAQVNIKIQRIIIDRQQAVVEWQWEDVENSTGKHSRADDAIVVDFADGRIKRWREYIDSETPRMG
ncbi:MAG: SgcJ/EcaC family oxidoreductase [Tildeniella nuda ZEHNDER 1965/U140]|nr:SgcJ/EcaC family oxidoreductase [Tildeniella nuda ZEHNDER 1965/U140]